MYYDVSQLFSHYLLVLTSRRPSTVLAPSWRMPTHLHYSSFGIGAGLGSFSRGCGRFSFFYTSLWVRPTRLHGGEKTRNAFSTTTTSNKGESSAAAWKLKQTNSRTCTHASISALHKVDYLASLSLCTNIGWTLLHSITLLPHGQVNICS